MNKFQSKKDFFKSIKVYGINNSLRFILQSTYESEKTNNNHIKIIKAALSIIHKIKYWKNQIQKRIRFFQIPIYKITKKELKYQKEHCFNDAPLISIVVPIYNTKRKYLLEMIRSVNNQTYGIWQLCLINASDEHHKYIDGLLKRFSDKDQRILVKKVFNQGISKNTNAAIEIASGEYIALLDHDDILPANALFEVVKTINENHADFIYSDEATFSGYKSHFIHTNYKPDYSPNTLLGNNYICHLAVFKKSLLTQYGSFRSEFDGSQDHDLFLRLTSHAKNIQHISKVLYFWRAHKTSVAQNVSAKNYAVDAGVLAVQNYVNNNKYAGTVFSSIKGLSSYKIKYEIIGLPKISIIIPNKDHVNELKKCLESIFNKTTYSNYEIVIVENNSEKQETFDYYTSLNNNEKINIVFYKGSFNYSKINNYGVEKSNGVYYIFLNNDTEVITFDWIQEMLMYSQQSNIGAVGVKLLYVDDTIQHAGTILGYHGIAGHNGVNLPRNNYGYAFRNIIACNVSAVTAACMMVSKGVFKQIGGFDENFEVAFNDVDFCLKCLKAGYYNLYTPFCELYHYESVSRGYEDSQIKIQRFNSEVAQFHKKWHNELILKDRYYNDNLSLKYEPYSLKRKKETLSLYV